MAKVTAPTLDIFRNTAIEELLSFDTAKSGLPSRSISPTAREKSTKPEPRLILEEVVNERFPIEDTFFNIVTEPAPQPTSRSTFPSASKSDTPIILVLPLTVISVLTENAREPRAERFLYKEIFPVEKFVTARSGRPSPSKSPVNTPKGEALVANTGPAVKLKPPLLR